MRRRWGTGRDDARGRRALISGALVAALAATSGCALLEDGGDAAEADADDTAAMGVVGLQVPADPGTGCGAAARTSPSDRRADRVVARCAPGSPGPRPLDGADPVPVTLAVSGPVGENQAPVLLAGHFDEWAAENLGVDVVTVESAREAYGLLAAGEVDAVAGDLHAAFFDQVVDGDRSRLVLGGAVPSAAGHTDVPQAGAWMATGLLTAPNRWSDVESRPVMIGDGIAGASAYPLMALLAQGDTSLNDVHVVHAGGAEAATGLLSGEAPMAWIDDPHWQEVAEDGQFELVATRPSEALGGLVLHERLLDDERDRAVGLAVVRAVIRTVNTHLSDDHRADDEVVAALVDATGWDEEQLRAGPPPVFDWEIRAGTVELIERALLPSGAVLYSDAQGEEPFVDRSLYQDVVGGR